MEIASLALCKRLCKLILRAEYYSTDNRMNRVSFSGCGPREPCGMIFPSSHVVSLIKTLASAEMHPPSLSFLARDDGNEHKASSVAINTPCTRTGIPYMQLCSYGEKRGSDGGLG